jgi:hypothetical protein
MTTNCGYRDGEIHPHVDRCYRAGAVDALRAAADEVEASIDAPQPDDIDAERGRRIGMEDAARILRNRADQIARNESVTS